MKNQQKLLRTLKTIIDILSANKNILFNNSDLFQISSSKINTPIGDPLTLFKQKSKIEDKIIDLGKLKNLIVHISASDSIVRLNHIGFGYIVDDKKLERTRLIKLITKTNHHLYEEESNDFGLWLFMGNTEKWEEPLVEFVPVEKSNDNYDKYLPHIQIDIDTKYDSDEIDELIKRYFGKKIISYHIAVINKITYIVRVKLGIMDGVNIFLDLATNSRNVKKHREVIKKLGACESCSE